MANARVRKAAGSACDLLHLCDDRPFRLRICSRRVADSKDSCALDLLGIESLKIGWIDSPISLHESHHIYP